MASYMIYKPASAVKLARPRIGTSGGTSLPPHFSDTTSLKREDSQGTDSGRTSTANFMPSPRQGAKRFEHNIPDHVLQAWPVVYDVHSKKQEEEREQAANQKRLQTPNLLSRRQTRTHSGIYRSSVLTPGEVEFMSSKRRTWRRSNTHPGMLKSSNKPMMKSYSGFQDQEHVFVTQELTQDCELYRDIQTRLSQNGGRTKIVPSTIEVTLPGLGAGSRKSRRKLMQQVETNPKDTSNTLNSVDDDRNNTNAAQHQVLLSRQKTERNSIRKRSPGAIRRQEELRQEQQFVLQPTTMSNPDWYESNGLKTPTILQKYLSDTFYTSPPKPEIDTNAILNYIRDKQSNVTYVPPPPSSGSEDEKEEKTQTITNTHVRNRDFENEPAVKPKKSGSHNDRKYETIMINIPGEKSVPPPRRTQRENGGLDLTVGGGKIHQKQPVTTKQHDQDANYGSQMKPKLEHSKIPPVRHDVLTQRPFVNEDRLNNNHLVNETEFIEEEEQPFKDEIYLSGDNIIQQNRIYQEDAALSDGSNVDDGKTLNDGTKRITVVLPSSESPREL